MESMMGDIIIALVRSAGGKIEIPANVLERGPNETVYVQQELDGAVTLKLKDVSTFEGV